MKDIECYIFDFDGTLADTQGIITKTMMMTIDKLQLEKRTVEQCRAMIGLPLAEAFITLLGVDEQTADLCAATYRRIFIDNNVQGAVKLFPHVFETLHQLHQKGCTLTIATSRSHASVVQFLEDMNLLDIVSYILGADDVERAKPNPFPVLKTLDELGFKPEETMVVGDTSFDILMGVHAGVRTCGVTYGNGTIEQLEEAHADYIIDDFAWLAKE
ncbi:MAG: HAD family hydrolase [Prevotella sp.]|nr:HAD family hydrolase [Prevotella sp.]